MFHGYKANRVMHLKLNDLTLSSPAYFGLLNLLLWIHPELRTIVLVYSGLGDIPKTSVILHTL